MSTQERSEKFAVVRAQIKAQGLSGAELARRVGKSSSFINLILRGGYPFYGAFGMPKFLIDHLECYGIDAGDLVLYQGVLR